MNVLSQPHQHPAAPPVGATAPSAPDQPLVDAATGGCTALLNSSDLLRGLKAVDINHNGATYRLQSTRLGKLILTK